MFAKNKPLPELESLNWLIDLTFLVDITEHLNTLNKNLQGRNKVVTQYFECTQAFTMKLMLWETQLTVGNTEHFSCLKSVISITSNVDVSRYKVKITGLLQQFETRFEIFRELEKEFTVFRSPFAANITHLAANLQLEIIDLKSDLDLKNKFTIVGLDTFYKFLLPKYMDYPADTDNYYDFTERHFSLQTFLELSSKKLMATKPTITPIIARGPKDRYIADLVDLRSLINKNVKTSLVISKLFTPN
ncbi:general transcription factor II-I repeat domain-containing protein 2-like [Octopus sinensis]|uniref:General transcription factor II-I repeat domain-containing protein 2-like n=1 Tax=Octopus sinensis TaxID=2607531 RepID=A0A6P7TQS3_9MOLL|nr:general transcription factor II-I repeat domain-containing protein 2-like [Octopus sinensis]